MSEKMNSAVQNRYDIVYLFDITDGNPNGDPDAGNMPRIDPETGEGLVTDVCLKRKVRNFVTLAKEGKPGFEIYVKERAILNQQHAKAWEKVEPDIKEKDRKNLPRDEAKARQLTAWMCKNFFDIRAFGAVMTTGVNCGQVRGPVQFGLARSVGPIVSLEQSVTRCAVTTEEESKAQEGGNRTMGRKFVVPYGLYRAHAFVSPNLAEQTGFSTDDLALLKQALNMMFEQDKSAARANMRPCRAVAFRHESKLGNARADQLFKRVKVAVKPELAEANRPPRKFDDYVVTVDETDLPEGVSVEHWVQ